MIRIVDKHLCCGCMACVQRCPKHCIEMCDDNEGFAYPVVDESLCVDCGMCESVCPLLNRSEAVEPLQTFAAKNLNIEERLRSSSGGMFFEMAKTVIDDDGVVFGVVFDNDWQAVFTHAETLDNVRRMMGSKYVQARVETAYVDAERFLKQGRQVMFTATPCQIAALRRFLRKDYDRLLTVDILCHGVPSPGVWKRYLRETVEKNTARRAVGKNTVLLSLNAMSSIEDIEFRDKRLGWKKYSFALTLAETTVEGEKNSVLLSHIHCDNPFMRGFLSNVYLRPSCYGCMCKNGVSHSDLTIGDFWGIERVMPDFDDDKGVSIVIVNSERGSRFFERLTVEARPSTVTCAASCNGGFDEHIRPHARRDEFFRRYAADREPVERILERVLRVPLRQRAKHKMKRAVKKVVRLLLPVAREST